MDSEVAERTARAAEAKLKSLGVSVDITSEYSDSRSTGSGLVLWAAFAKNDDIDFLNPVILGCDVLGKKGVSSEEVGESCAKKMISLIESKAPIDENLGDALIPLMGLVNPSQIKVSSITDHIKTNIIITEMFLDVKFSIEDNVISCKGS